MQHGMGVIKYLVLRKPIYFSQRFMPKIILHFCLSDHDCNLKIVLRNVGNLSSKSERCVVFRFQVNNNWHGTETDGQPYGAP